MNTNRTIRAGWALAGCAALALLAVVPQAAAAAAPADQAALEKQLADARARLDADAREVAKLSGQLYGGDEIEIVKRVHGGPPGAMLGVNIGGQRERDEGVDVVGVSPGGPAERAGLRAGDVIVAVNGQALKKSGDRSPASQLVAFMRTAEAGQSVKVEYVRDGKRQTIEVKAAPAEPPMARMMRDRMMMMPGPEGMDMPRFHEMMFPDRPFGPLELVPMTPKLGRYFGTDTGLLVVRAPTEQGLPLEDGDVLLTVGGRTPESPGQAFRILHSYEPGEKVKLGVLRNRKRLELEATVPSRGAMDGHAMHPQRLPMPPPPPAPPKPAVAPGVTGAT
jgi:membrane-associated protease RseP (regulator of RpoE activity)